MTGRRSSPAASLVAPLHDRIAFKALQARAGSVAPSIEALRKDAQRNARLRLDVDGLHADLTRHSLDSTALDHLLELADECDVSGAIAAMACGDIVNTTEQRPALHMALRAEVGESEFADAAMQERQRMHRLADEFRHSDVTDLVHLGVGGSLLGPQLIAEALPHQEAAPRVHFLGNTDPLTLRAKLAELDPASTAVSVVSKSFTTTETMLNAEAFRAWMGSDWQRRFVAVTARPERAQAWGIAEDRVLGFADGVGGRFSLWSPVSFAAVVGMGLANFEALLAGARTMDEHFLGAPSAQNLPILSGLLGVWHSNLCGASGRAVVAYADGLFWLADWLKQLEMESNGKGVTHAGDPAGRTSPVVIGGVGSDVQHSFMQQLHQSAEPVPVDFIACTEIDPDFPRHSRLLMANCVGQANALLKGRQSGDPHKDLPGNRSSSLLLLPRLDAHYLGMLLALYEHRAYVQSVLWGVNAFDQWGVELGKSMARDVELALEAGQSLHDLI